MLQHFFVILAHPHVHSTDLCLQFEKEEDPFGLDQFLDTAKRASGSKRSKDDDERSKDSKKKRRDY